MTMTQFIANLVRVPLMEDPGTRYRYSESSTVLGRLVDARHRLQGDHRVAVDGSG